MQMRKRRRKRVAVTSVMVALAAAGSAAAFQQLPAGDQVNNDPGAGINPALGVDGGDPTNADVVGGALTAGKVNVPWAVFRQHTSGKDQIFSRSFAAGAWTTRGIGTVGGKSSGSSTFSGSLNFDQGQDGEAPAIDFAGTGRTVPWATWYEDTAAFASKKNIFASRFDNNPDANQNKWIFGGQGRGLGTGTVPVPSLNIHTNQDAENPSVAGGSAADPTKPGPWVTWQEIGANAPGAGKDQIFTVKPVGPGSANCDGIKPLGVNDGTGHVPAIGGFCWQQVGIERLGADPSMNVDRTRDGIEPDIAFTGTNDSVPWVVWYETGNSADSLNNNEMVFAAKGVANASADGGFQWVAVGGTGSGTLDNSAHGGTCGASTTAEAACSLNKVGTADAEDPRVAAGTMTAGSPTSPWVTWDESVGGIKKIFVSRLVTSPAPAHFELANNGAPISIDANNATRPDITFDGNTPYVSWREDIGGGVTKGFLGHFSSPDHFVLDATNVPLTPTATADVREPISSGCTANPFTSDGSACPGNAVGTPFFLFTTGTSPLNLLANAYSPNNPTTGGASNVTTSSATINGSVTTNGAAVNVHFDYGTSTLYGSSTAVQKTATGDSATPLSFSAALSGLPANTVIHYRMVATSDFGTFNGQDQTLKTAAIPPTPKPGHASFGRVKVSGTTASLRASCNGNSVDSCKLSFKLTVTETLLGKKIVAVSARSKPKRHKVTVTVGTASTRLNAGRSRVVKISLNGKGKGLLRKHRTLRTTLHVTQSGKRGSVLKKTVTFKAPKKKRHR
jgi:hypothetical protein